VAEHGEEFVLASVGCLGPSAGRAFRFVQARVLDGERGAIGQVLEQRSIVFGEGRVRLVARRRDRADHAARRLQGSDEEAFHLQRVDVRSRAGHRAGAELGRADLGDQDRAARLEHAARKPLPFANAQMRSDLAQALFVRRVEIADHDGVEPLAVGRHERDGARRSQVRHHLVGDFAQDRIDVGVRGRQHARRFGQETQPVGRAPLAIGEQRPVERVRALLCDDEKETELLFFESLLGEEAQAEDAHAHVFDHERQRDPRPLLEDPLRARELPITLA
jgi:hypothetical protein